MVKPTLSYTTEIFSALHNATQSSLYKKTLSQPFAMAAFRFSLDDVKPITVAHFILQICTSNCPTLTAQACISTTSFSEIL